MVTTVVDIGELDRIVDWMRLRGVAVLDHGAIAIKLGDEPVIPTPPVVISETERVQLEEVELRARWDDHWNIAMLSSSGAIPEFPGVERAKDILG